MAEGLNSALDRDSMMVMLSLQGTNLNPLFKEVSPMAFFSDIVRAAKAKGFEPTLQAGKNIIMMYQCPQCHRAKMGKFLLKTDRRAYVHACVCGYRNYTRKAATTLHKGS
jgi:cbb3-type cytochrome oxidase cytochrome c subunit